MEPRRISLVLLFAICATSTFAQTGPVIVGEDVNTTPVAVSSNPNPGQVAGYVLTNPPLKDRAFVKLGGYSYFVATTLATGEELFRTDGTTAGSGLVADIRPGVDGSGIQSLYSYNGKLWFCADDGVSGSELWTSDGTAAGTKLVKDVYPGTKSGMWAAGHTGSHAKFIGFGGKLYFPGTDAIHGNELWCSDGTTAGTGIFEDMLPGAASGIPGNFLVSAAGSLLYFSGFSATLGNELWSTDGTAASTQVAVDVAPGPESGNPYNLVLRGGKIFFLSLGWSGSSSPNLFVTDGTPAGTKKLTNYFSYSQFDLQSSVEVGGQLLYVGRYDLGWELYVSDGTIAGTHLLQDFSPGVASSDPLDLIIFAGAAYFTATFGPMGQRHLYRTMGVFGTTVAVTTFTTLQHGIPKLSGLTEFNGELYFAGLSSPVDPRLWKTGGATGVFTLVKDFGQAGTSSPDLLSVVTPTKMVFVLSTDRVGSELYVTDGTSFGTSILADLEPIDTTASSFPFALSPIGHDQIVFHAVTEYPERGLFSYSKSTGLSLIKAVKVLSEKEEGTFSPAFFGDKAVVLFRELHGPEEGVWVTDGTVSGTKLLHANSSFGSYQAAPFLFHAATGRAFFADFDSSNGWELWSTDGTASGTSLFLEINTTGFGSDPQMFTAYGDRFVFSADDGIHGRKLWLSDGTLAGTFMLGGPDPQRGFSPEQLTVVGQRVFFAARDSVYGKELWTSDGTVAGTHLVKDMYPGIGGQYHSLGLTPFKGKAIFSARNAAGYTAPELMVSDGTAGGTQALADLTQGGLILDPHHFTVFEGELYFLTYSPGAPNLYKVDLAAGGATLIVTLPFAPLPSGTYYELVASGDKLFIRADQLWVSDGTAAGTIALNFPGTPGSFEAAGGLIAASAGVYFAATGEFGRELYFSDGTVAGTALVSDINPGLADSSPEKAILLNGELLFAATELNIGTELFHHTAPGAMAVDLGMGYPGATLTVAPPVLGGNSEITGTGTPVGSIGFLVVSGVAKAQDNSLMQSGSVSWLDPASAIAIHPITTFDWSYTAHLPAVPAMVGLQFHLQAWYLMGGAFPATTSNGVKAVLGN